MKTKLLPSFFLLIFQLSLLTAQSPQGINYQAVARDLTTGNPIINTSMQVKLAIKPDSLGSTIIYQEQHSVTTNNFGLITVVLGKGTRITTTKFNEIDWSITPKFIMTEINYGGWKNMGTSRLWSVPYSMVAGDLAGPVDKLGIKATTTSPEDALFEVKNKDGYTLFGVYNEGVRIFIDDRVKGSKGGFAVGGFDNTKSTDEYFRVTRDSVRITLDSNPDTKGTKGGFAVGGFDNSKGIIQNYLDVSHDSIRIYIDDTGKGTKGGFAVGGFDQTKGGNANFLNIATDAAGIIDPPENRILWYPFKNAFLTGRILIETPDNVGENSFASGYESKAKGDWSQALGFMTTALGNYSTAIGKNNIAQGENSFAFGNQANAIGNDSYAFGTGATATGPKSFALGSVGVDSTGKATQGTVASGEASFALGFGSVASSRGSFTFGVQDTASGPFSLAMGYWTRSQGAGSATLGGGTTVEPAGWFGLATGILTKAGNWASSAFGDRSYASGHTSFATGFNTVASGQLSSTFGDQTVAPLYNSMAIGRYNNYSTSSLGEPVLMVGNGTSPSARTNAMTVYKNGNLETTGYSAWLGKTHIYSDRIEVHEGGTGNRFAWIDFHGDDTYTDFGFRIIRSASGANSSTGLYHRGTGDFVLNAQENAAISFATANTERMRIRYNGNVGIGVALPGYKLEVAGTANLNDGISSGIALRVNGYEALWFDTPTTTYSWGYGGTANVFADHMSVGTTADPGIYGLYVAGSVFATGGWAGSDARWKKDLEPLHNIIPDVFNLQGYKFMWRTEDFPDKNFDEGRQIGLIAQDVEKVFPELVKTDENGFKAVSYEKLTVVLLESIKEQQKQIEAQNERIEKLERLVEKKRGGR